MYADEKYVMGNSLIKVRNGKLFSTIIYRLLVFQYLVISINCCIIKFVYNTFEEHMNIRLIVLVVVAHGSALATTLVHKVEYVMK